MEKIFRNYCRGWEEGKVEDILKTLTEDVSIRECYGPEYRGKAEVEAWATKWLAEHSRVKWEILGFITGDNNLAAEWRFTFQKANGEKRSFLGASFVTFEASQIKSIHEYWQTG